MRKNHASYCMKLVGREILSKFMRKHAASVAPLSAWIDEVEGAEWDGPADVRRRYASASFLSGNRIIFNIGGNNFRLLVVAYYSGKSLLIDRIGTHAEYDKWKL